MSKFNKAVVKSISGKFEEYVIDNVVSIQFIKGHLIITSIDKTSLKPSINSYLSEDVVINIL